MTKRFNLLTLFIFVIIWGLLGRVIANTYLTYDFYKENYDNFGHYIKSLFTVEHYQLWWKFLFSSTQNLLIMSAVFTPLVIIITIFYVTDLKDKLAERKF